MFDHPSFDAHEGVHWFTDPASGLRAIIAVHSTARGPAAGGVRLWRYPRTEDALRDVLRLSRGMSFKNAVADIPLGGGKAVILAPEAPFDREALFEAFGRAVDRLGGCYVTAEDVGVGPDDMRVIARMTRHVAGLPEGVAASGDPSPITARGVFLGIKTCVARAFGRSDLRDVRVAVQGVGHVGAYLCKLLSDAGARLIVADVNRDAARQVAERYGAERVEADAIFDAPADVFSPNALGAILTPATIGRLKVAIIAGGANNQLETEDLAHDLAARGILYAPDFVINGGGIINVAAEISGVYDPDWVQEKLGRLIHTLEEVLDRAAAENRTTHEVAVEIARARIAAARDLSPAAAA